MNQMERIAIEHECARLVYGHCHFIDAYDYEAYMQLWAEDGVWEMQGGPAKGHAGIRKYLDSRAPGVTARHQCCNVLIDVIDAHTARGRCYVTYYRGTPDPATGSVVCSGPNMVGEYLDEFKLTSKGWRFARRVVNGTMRAAARA